MDGCSRFNQITRKGILDFVSGYVVALNTSECETGGRYFNTAVGKGLTFALDKHVG